MIDFETAIESAIDAARRAAPSPGRSFATDSRAYICSAVGCERSGYARGLCNAHYIRSKTGRPLDAPLTIRKRHAACSECGDAIGKNSGWGLCAKHYRKRRREAIKDAVIDALGGCCARCDGKFHRAVFDFHHVGAKSESPSAMLQNGSPSEIAAELSKCVLLCANCHRLEHHDD